MKLKALIIGAICFISGLSAHAQQKDSTVKSIDAVELTKQGALKGKNIVITDASLNKYVGTWVWKNDNASLAIELSTKVYHLGKNNQIFDVTMLSGSYQYTVDGKVIYSISGKDLSGSSGGKKDTVNLFMDIQSHKSHVALLAIYLLDNTLKLEVEKNRFEFRNDESFELPEPVILTKQLYSFGQKIVLSDTVTVALPDRFEKLSKDEASSYVVARYKNSKMAQNIVTPSGRNDNKHFFKVDNILIKLVNGSRRLKDKDNYLSDTKKGFDAMSRGVEDYNNYTSEIEKINNNSVLVMYNVAENVGYYNFFMNDSTNTKALNGTLQFNIADKDNATKILDDLLDSVEFTK